MKKVILLAFAALIMVGCSDKTKAEREEAKHLNGFSLVVIDSCEYLRIGVYRGHFAHKGNCRFCKERRQRELEELIIKLKEK